MVLIRKTAERRMIPLAKKIRQQNILKTYTQHQLLILLLMKEYLSEDQWDTVERNEIMDYL